MSIESVIARIAELGAQATATTAPTQPPGVGDGFRDALGRQLSASPTTTLGSGALLPTTDASASAFTPGALSVLAGVGAPAKAAGADSAGAALVRAATRWLGTPYSWGGGNVTGPTRGIAQGAGTLGFDCSSLVQYAYAQTGTTIPRTSQEQFKAGSPVAPGDLRPGDLVFFDGTPPGHVGMYLGNGQFLHAPHTGDHVRISSLTSGYYHDAFVGARRFGG